MILPKGFTLVEIMIVMTVIGILVSALFPTYTGYVQRGRDTNRITGIDKLAKAHAGYFNDNDQYPNDDLGCVNQIAISRYTDNVTVQDPLPNHSKLCGADDDYYGYASGTFAFNSHVYSLIAFMEQPYAGNYSGDLLNLTGALTNLSYTNATTLTVKGAGQYYVRIP